jgi:hypothetical protein
MERFLRFVTIATPIIIDNQSAINKYKKYGFLSKDFK